MDMRLFPMIFCKVTAGTEKVEIRNMTLAGCRRSLMSEEYKADQTNIPDCRGKQGMKHLEATVMIFRD